MNADFYASAKKDAEGHNGEKSNEYVEVVAESDRVNKYTVHDYNNISNDVEQSET